MNALYDSGRNAFLTGDIDWVTDDIRAVLVDAGTYAFSAAHQFLNDISVPSRVAEVALAGKTAVGGVADASDTTFTAVTGATCEAIVLYKSTGVDATSPLIAYIDTASGLPVTPNSGAVTVQWDSGSNKIFKL